VGGKPAIELGPSLLLLGRNGVFNRWLIEAGNPPAEQRAFFEEFLYSGACAFFAAAQKSPSAAFYQEVAEYARQFFEIEKIAFEMD
jgi:TorA maturation chaperone TorD